VRAQLWADDLRANIRILTLVAQHEQQMPPRRRQKENSKVLGVGKSSRQVEVGCESRVWL